MIEDFNQVVEFPLELNRGDTRTLAFQLTTGVETELAFDLTGSTFELLLMNALGTVVVTLTAVADDGLVAFSMQLEQLALLTPGKSGRFEFARLIDGGREPIAQGNTIITGVARG